MRGVGILVQKQTRHIMEARNISPGVMYLTLMINQKYSHKIIQAYAPTTKYTEDEVENFYEDIITALQNRKTHYTILSGNFNAKIGSQQGKAETAIGHHGLENRNERETTSTLTLHITTTYI